MRIRFTESGLGPPKYGAPGKYFLGNDRQLLPQKALYWDTFFEGPFFFFDLFFNIKKIKGRMGIQKEKKDKGDLKFIKIIPDIIICLYTT